MPVDAKRSRPVFQKLDRDLANLRSKPEAKSIHRFRTGTRRLQILLDLSDHLSRNEKKLIKQLGKIRKRAGKLRDFDVQLAALRGLKTPLEPRRKTQLTSNLIELRREQEKKLRKAATSSTIRELRKRLKRAAEDFDPKTCRDPLAAATVMLQELKAGSATLSEDLLHQYRIVTKRARYAADFAAPSPRAAQLIADLKKTQDALGDWHDWLTLTQTSIQILGDVRESPLVAELRNVMGAKYRNAVAVVSRIRTVDEPGDSAHTSATAA